METTPIEPPVIDWEALDLKIAVALGWHWRRLRLQQEPMRCLLAPGMLGHSDLFTDCDGAERSIENYHSARKDGRNYHENLQAALDACLKLGFYGSLYLPGPAYPADMQWYFIMDPKFGDIQGEAETAAQAVCLALVAAIRERRGTE